MLITNYDRSKIFVFDNRYSNADYTNSTYDDVTLTVGTIMGRVSATNEIIPLASGASDGSQYPVGILADTYTIEAGDTVTLEFCTSGDVVSNLLVFDGSDDLDTVISSRTLRDRIGSDTIGVNLVVSTDLTDYDNQ